MRSKHWHMLSLASLVRQPLHNIQCEIFTEHDRYKSVMVDDDDGDTYLFVRNECHFSIWFGNLVFYFSCFLLVFIVCRLSFILLVFFCEIEINFDEQMLILIKISTSVVTIHPEMLSNECTMDFFSSTIL